jgi:hypothetical protein
MLQGGGDVELGEMIGVARVLVLKEEPMIEQLAEPITFSCAGQGSSEQVAYERQPLPGVADEGMTGVGGQLPGSSISARLAGEAPVVEPTPLADLVVNHDLGADYHTNRIDTDRKTRSHIRQLQALGYTVTLTPAA